MSQYSNSQFNLQDENSSWSMTYNRVPEGSVVLDVGCSIGTFGELLIHEKNCIVDGIEINDEDFKVAQKKLRNMYKYDIERDVLDIKQKYDLIFMGDVVEHLAQPVKALSRLKKLLKKDGFLLFSIPNITHMSVRLMLMSGQIKYGKTGLLDETHLHFYNQEEVIRVFNDAGMKIREIQSVKRDIPEKILQEELNNLGLKPTVKFLKMSKNTNAASYQFIGTAIPARGLQKSELVKKSPININDAHFKRLTSLIAEKEKALSDVKSEKDFLKNELMIERLEHNKKRDEINRIIKSKSYKIGRSIMYIPGKSKSLIKKSKETSVLKKALKNIYKVNSSGSITVGIFTRDGIQSPTSSAFLRLVSPLTYGENRDRIRLIMLPDIVQNYNDEIDIIIVQRTALRNLSQAEMLIKQSIEKDIKIIVDTDDAFDRLDRSHQQYKVQADYVNALIKIKDYSERIWTSTDELAKDYSLKRTVYSNSVDSRVWKINKLKFSSGKTIKAVYMGTATHGDDFDLVIKSLDKMNRIYKNSIHLTIIGVSSDIPKREWISVMAPPKDSRMYPYFARWFSKKNNFDIGLAPLKDSEFNKAKSDIKVLDYLCLGVVPVVSDLKPYQGKDINKLIVKVGYGKNDWFNVLKNIYINKEEFFKKYISENAEYRTNLLNGSRSVSQIAKDMGKEIEEILDND